MTLITLGTSYEYIRAHLPFCDWFISPDSTSSRFVHAIPGVSTAFLFRWNELPLRGWVQPMDGCQPHFVSPWVMLLTPPLKQVAIKPDRNTLPRRLGRHTRLPAPLSTWHPIFRTLPQRTETETFGYSEDPLWPFYPNLLTQCARSNVFVCSF